MLENINSIRLLQRQLIFINEVSNNTTCHYVSNKTRNAITVNFVPRKDLTRLPSKKKNRWQVDKEAIGLSRIQQFVIYM